MTRDPRPLALVTNDDGIDCRFLLELVAAVAPAMRVVVAAPKGEQSWIGRAFSRNRDVAVESRSVPGAEKAWAIDGTPSDCVNIALGHLMSGERPDIVLSGINIGYNVSMPLGLSSGTMAGAIEGAAWGLRAVAFSLDLKQEAFESLRHNNGEATGAVLGSLRYAAARSAEFAGSLLREPAPRELMIHNYNFPCDCGPGSPVERTSPADLRFDSLYECAGEGRYRFRWNDGVNRTSGGRSDLDALARGAISHTLLNYSALGRHQDVTPRV